ncbi:ThiF family adenylyltransferase [Corynebacterium halotolerans]|uniref:Thiamine biosynthesis protein ThiF n=1 Tax=Corynebacterium halotolerans YIM 70093 = DSM 44683 TaxID=1121362 RepID=M1NTI8_9CORY|nr:ThiF family adenylyltransferase [Corynebacterium halotolerans]AGF72792.1 thiamine biosynthesis protein ThiF [Corynebacterium halotolerans YIM 70093 = DSM 44683]
MTELSDLEMRRIARQLALPGFGIEQQERLADARVLVIGGGGLGCPAMQSLASVGVGHITVIDDDTVDITNIHRQILFGAEDEGRPKVEVVAGRLRALQPGIRVTALRERITVDNAVELLGQADLVLDGSDTFATKYLVADAAEITGTPLVWGTVLRFRGDAALWWSGPGAPSDGVGLRDLFPEQPDADSVPDCATAGVLGVTTAVVGGLMATEAVKHLAGIGESVPGRLLSYGALSSSMRSFAVARDPGREPVRELDGDYGAAACAAPSVPPEELELVTSGRAVALDVREPHEKLLTDLPVDSPGLHLPMSWVSPGRVDEVLAGVDGTVVVYCASGMRSARFVDEYSENARRAGVELVSLPGGVDGL